jgi:hypothetical protein
MPKKFEAYKEILLHFYKIGKNSKKKNIAVLLTLGCAESKRILLKVSSQLNLLNLIKLI